MKSKGDLSSSKNLNEEDKYKYKNLRFEITENISKIEITEFNLCKHESDNVIEFTIRGQIKCYIYFLPRKVSMTNLLKDVRKKLTQNLGSKDNQVFEPAMSDIETQIINNRKEVFNISFNINTNDNETDKYKIKFKEDVLILRKQFEESSQPYRQWQLKVAEKFVFFGK